MSSSRTNGYDTYHTDENPYYNKLAETTERHLEYRLNEYYKERIDDEEYGREWGFNI